MKFVILKHLGASLVLIGGMTAYGIANAHGDESHNQAPVAATEAISTAPVAEPLPATAENIWKAIDQKTAELAKTIHGDSLSDVHHLAYAVRDLVAALPARSIALPTDRQAKVKSSTKYVATLADRLDASGDANDKVSAQANYEKLLKVLTALRANYATKAID